MILSASRRTDIPAFYSKWFMSRLKEGFVCVRNPMNVHQVSKIPLTPNKVDCIVFWTKDPKPLLCYLDELDTMGYKYYFQFTITPYGKEIELNLRDKTEIIKTFKELSERIGKEKVILRYDPIFITDNGKYTHEFHIRAFRKLCEQLYTHTDRVVISFLDGYRKIFKNIQAMGIREPNDSDMHIIARDFSDIIKNYGLKLETCAEKINLEKFGIDHSRCIDGALVEKILNCKITQTNNKGKELKDGSRGDCGCLKCIDIGQYDTCMHKCLYCYANINKDKAIENYKCHSLTSPLILGEINEDRDNVTLRNEKETLSLKQAPTIEDF